MEHELKVVETGLDLGTKFLSTECAYFLGLLMAYEKAIINGKRFWLAPVRHNPTHYSVERLEEHLSNVRVIASTLGKDKETLMYDFFKMQGVVLSKFNAGKKGFVTLFEEIKIGYTLDEFVNDISEPILSSHLEVIRSFIVGVFDGRSSFDKTAGYISIDFENYNAFRLVDAALNRFSINTNFNNLPTARVRNNTSAAPRKSQLRIKESLTYLRKIGFVSSIRYKKTYDGLIDSTAHNLFGSYITVTHDEILSGLKTVKYSTER